MVYRGKVANGQIVLDAGVSLPEGTVVEITVCEGTAQSTKEPVDRTLFELLKPFVGAVEDLPSDMSVNHDHYLYGAPKRT